MYEEAMDSIQKTNDTFRQDNKTLKEKIQKLGQKINFIQSCRDTTSSIERKIRRILHTF